MSEELDSGVLARNFHIADRTLSFSLKNTWKIAEKYHIEAQKLSATNSEIGECTLWRCFLNEVRTFFKENLDAEF